MKKVGEILKAEREKKGLSLHEIGMSLKINAKILKSIEEGSGENLPAKTFLRGFIRSYAQYLKLDAEEILRLFQEEHGEPTATATQGQGVSTRPSIERLHAKTPKNEDPTLETLSSSNKWLTAVVAIILLILIGSVIKVMNKYQKETEVATAEEVAHLEPVTDATPVVATTDSTTTTTLALGAEAIATPVAGLASSTTLLTTTTTIPMTTTTAVVTTTTTTLKPVTTTTALKPSTTTTLKVTTTTLKPTTTTLKPTTTTLKPTTTTMTTTTTLKPTTTTVAVSGKPVEAIIEATAAVSIRFRLAGSDWKTIDLTPGQIHTFKSPGAIELEVSDGGAVNAIVNGVMKGTLGKSGSPAVFTAK